MPCYFFVVSLIYYCVVLLEEKQMVGIGVDSPGGVIFLGSVEGYSACLCSWDLRIT